MMLKHIKLNTSTNFKIIEKQGFLILAISGRLGFTILKLHSTIIKKTNDSISIIAPRTTINTINKLIYNTRKGLTNGFKKYLEVVGIGYKLSSSEKTLRLDLGFSHPVFFNIPLDIEIETKKNRFLKVYGTDMNQVTQIASRLKIFKKPDVYKGKGVRYKKEILLLKQGKKKKK